MTTTKKFDTLQGIKAKILKSSHIPSVLLSDSKQKHYNIPFYNLADTQQYVTSKTLIVCSENMYNEMK
jgi:hypothetical protein